MSDHPDHCPFLNRSDARCSAHFSLNNLNDAFDHCFDRYSSCTVYRELLKERRDRRAGKGTRRGFWARGGFDAVTSSPAQTAADIPGSASSRSNSDARPPVRLAQFTRLTIAHRDP